MEVREEKNNKKSKKKNTGISNMPLPKGFSFYHTDILVKIFGAKRISRKDKKVLDRVYKEDDVIVYGDFLNIDTDFLLYTFLLEKLERQNTETHKDKLNFEVVVSYREIHDFFEKDLVKRGGREVFKTYRRSLWDLKTISLKIKNKVVSLIQDFEDNWDQDFDQHQKFTVTFPKEIKSLGGTQALLNKSQFKELPTQAHKKLYAYIFSFSKEVTTFNVSTLYKVLGYHAEGTWIVGHKSKGEFVFDNGEKEKFYKKLKNARSNLKSILDWFYFNSLIERSDTFEKRGAKQYEIVRTKDIK
ncbi:hypothetical protein [Pseudoalteromonas gelatinilytica]|uniref:Uncharacterized protein n=1 Tax=Pseudoalteromonas gelatinilytica TaxID=1703256 RepID=A0ABQ1TDN7_9GAMM|nr:hypothetical protein [Pseudoalteromonas profundi]GGE91421.1 hypothetical protein GCM10008027_15360 [Pseudoalteromonas profundi]